MLRRSDRIGDSQRWRHLAGSGWIRRCGAGRADADPWSKQLPDHGARERAESGAAGWWNGGSAGDPAGLLKVDMQIDYTGYSGLAVNEQNTVFVISGGTPAGIGKNPSPMLGEVLCFEDGCPADRRADFVDLRGDTLPNPPASGGNVGDGDSDGLITSSIRRRWIR